jgi:hypothetical protein
MSVNNDDDTVRPPDLQEWVRRYGGYNRIDWEAWDRANAEYQAERRAMYQRERNLR